MSTIAVTPPTAAAAVADAKPSQSVRPGSLTWTCVSTTPGMSTASSGSVSSTLLAQSASSGPTAAMTPSRTPIAAGRVPSGSVATPRRIRSNSGMPQR